MPLGLKDKKNMPLGLNIKTESEQRKGK